MKMTKKNMIERLRNGSFLNRRIRVGPSD